MEIKNLLVMKHWYMLMKQKLKLKILNSQKLFEILEKSSKIGILFTSVTEKSSTSLMNIGRVRTTPFETAKKKKLVIIADHTGTEVTIFDHGIASIDFFTQNKIYQFSRIQDAW